MVIVIFLADFSMFGQDESSTLTKDRTFVQTSNQRNSWSIYSLDYIKEVEKSKDTIDNHLENNTKGKAPEPAIVRVDTADERNKEGSNLNVKLKSK